MIKKIRHGRMGTTYIPECDCCGSELDIEWDYLDAVSAIRSHEWSAKKVDGEWVNYCPECQSMMNSAATEFDDEDELPFC